VIVSLKHAGRLLRPRRDICLTGPLATSNPLAADQLRRRVIDFTIVSSRVSRSYRSRIARGLAPTVDLGARALHFRGHVAARVVRRREHKSAEWRYKLAKKLSSVWPDSAARPSGQREIRA